MQKPDLFGLTPIFGKLQVSSSILLSKSAPSGTLEWAIVNTRCNVAMFQNYNIFYTCWAVLKMFLPAAGWVLHFCRSGGSDSALPLSWYGLITRILD